MSFPLLKIVSVPDELAQLDLIGDLRSQRDELVARLAAVSGKLSRLQAADAGQSSAQNALDALAAAELAEMQQWLSSASGEAAPRPDMETLSELNHQLASAMAQAATQRQAAANLNAEHAEISTKLAAVAERLEAASIDAITERFADELAELRRLDEQIQDKQAKVFGAVVFMRETAERMMSARTDKATLLFRRLESLASLRQPEFQPSIGATNAAAPAWQALFTEMLK